ncbi:MAG: hypothetical protein JXR05_00110 [Flavobacteriaceae bacterium]
MTKVLITYFFSLILIASIITPTYFTLLEGKCEISTLVDMGEDEENKGKESKKDLEVKIYYSLNNSLFYKDLEKKKRIRFYSKNYTSYYKKQVSPPPEFTA